MIRLITRLIGTQLLGSQLRMLATAVAGAIVLAGCATTPADQPDGAAASNPPAPAASTASTSPAANGAAGAKPPTKTVTLPEKGRVSLAEYRAQMRDQLMKTDNAAPAVADCAAHASWVVPRSPIFDALKIPTGALANGAATVEPWNGRFAQGKQAVPVTSVVTFSASAHKRQGDAQWQTVKVRCGYDDGMMLAYELLDSNGDTISEPAAAPAVSNGSSHSKAKGKGKSSAKSSASKSSSSKTSTKASTKKKH